MKHYAFIFLAALVCGVAHGQDSQRLRLEKHLYTLAADSLNGRQAGTPDAARAAEYITRQWREMGLKPMWGNDYRMPFTHPYTKGGPSYRNLVAVIEGNDPVLKDEYIVVGAHYDHLGVRNGEIYNGADDNASGSSCVIEVARQLLAKQGQLRRSVIICAFDAEEIGLYGSSALVKQLKSKEMLKDVKLMMSVDMVGWYKANGSLVLEGVGTLAEGSRLTDPATLGTDIKIKTKKFETSIFTATDTEPFAKEGIPTLAVSTGLKSPYHKPGDDANLIDYEGLDHVTDYVAALTLAASSRAGQLSSGHVAAKHGGKHTGFHTGVAVGFNSTWLSFNKAALTTYTRIGFTGGLMMQYDFSRHWGLHADVLYGYARCPYPDGDNFFNSYYGYNQHSLSVPLMLQLHTSQDYVNVYLNLGGFYSYVFDAGFYDRPATPANPDYSGGKNHWGIAFGFGLVIANHWQIDCRGYYNLNKQFDTSAGLPEARLNSVAFTLGYYF